jgi:hypothetical protein
MRVYGYVVMPEHVHLLLSEPGQGTLADAMHYLKLSFSKRLRSKRLCVQGSPFCAPGSALFWPNLGSGPFWQKTLSRPQRKRRARVHRKASVSAPESGETRTSKRSARLEVEQFPPLCLAGKRSGRDRIRMDGQRSRVEGVRWACTNLPQPRLASKSRTRTWGTGRLQREHVHSATNHGSQ